MKCLRVIKKFHSGISPALFGSNSPGKFNAKFKVEIVFNVMSISHIYAKEAVTQKHGINLEYVMVQ